MAELPSVGRFTVRAFPPVEPPTANVDDVPHSTIFGDVAQSHRSLAATASDRHRAAASVTRAANRAVATNASLLALALKRWPAPPKALVIDSKARSFSEQQEPVVPGKSMPLVPSRQRCPRVIDGCPVVNVKTWLRQGQPAGFGGLSKPINTLLAPGPTPRDAAPSKTTAPSSTSRPGTTVPLVTRHLERAVNKTTASLERRQSEAREARAAREQRLHGERSIALATRRARPATYDERRYVAALRSDKAAASAVIHKKDDALVVKVSHSTPTPSPRRSTMRPSTSTTQGAALPTRSQPDLSSPPARVPQPPPRQSVASRGLAASERGSLFATFDDTVATHRHSVATSVTDATAAVVARQRSASVASLAPTLPVLSEMGERRSSISNIVPASPVTARRPSARRSSGSRPALSARRSSNSAAPARPVSISQQWAEYMGGVSPYGVQQAEADFAMLSYGRPHIALSTFEEYGAEHVADIGTRRVLFAEFIEYMSRNALQWLPLAAFIHVLYPLWPREDIVDGVKDHAAALGWAIGLSREDAEFIHRLWLSSERFQHRGREVIDFEAFSKVVCVDNVALNPKDVRALFVATDDDGNGYLDKSEFAQFLMNSVDVADVVIPDSLASESHPDTAVPSAAESTSREFAASPSAPFRPSDSMLFVQ